jgi:hypothetical protein
LPAHRLPKVIIDTLQRMGVIDGRGAPALVSTAEGRV